MSFGWTSDRLLAGNKTVTRRKWKKPWVLRDDLVQAWSKGPHRGGHKLGVIKILDVTLEDWDDTTLLHDNEAKREGFTDWLEFKEMIQDNRQRKLSGLIWRIEFEVVGKLK